MYGYWLPLSHYYFPRCICIETIVFDVPAVYAGCCNMELDVYNIHYEVKTGSWRPSMVRTCVGFFSWLRVFAPGVRLARDDKGWGGIWEMDEEGRGREGEALR